MQDRQDIKKERAKSSPRNKFLLVLALLLFILAVTLLTTEIGLRLLGLFAAITNTTEDFHKIEQADYFIACFGDSYTQGAGASSRKFTYPKQLERILSERYPNLKILVINEGFGGLNSSETAIKMESRLKKYPRKPDLIIVLTSHNNCWNLHSCSALLKGYASLPRNKRWVEKLESTKIGKLAVILDARSKNFSAILAKIHRDKWHEVVKEDVKKTGAFVPLLDPKNGEEIYFLKKWIEYDVAQMRDIARSSGARILFATYAIFDENCLIREAAFNADAPYCDAIENGHQWREMGLMAADGKHYNDRGYAVFAEHIANCMESHGSIPKKRQLANY